MSDMNKPNEQANSTSGETLSLNDDRRVKTLSPGALVVKRFFRNRLAVLGLVILAIMFLFSFVGGMISPYREDEQFYTYTYMEKEYVGVTRNEDFRYVSAEGADFGSAAQAQFLMAQMMGKTEFDYKDVTYGVAEEGKDFYSVSVDGSVIAIAYKDIVNAADNKEEPAFNVKYEALKLYTNDGTGSFTADGMELSLDEDGNILQGEEVLGYISRFVVQSKENGVVIPRDFKESLEQVLDAEGTEFAYTGEDGEEHNYTITYDASTKIWSVMQETETYVYSQYEAPSAKHPLGTDTNGMDMLTRLMYGGRVSLIIGFIVVVIECLLGVILGGLSGYFGKWVDNLIMRIVDIFYCIPSMPLIIILGAAMDGMRVDPKLRMLYLMLILGILGWPGIARLVRGQILSLREQEFILGLGVKFPFASWGNIINDVKNSYVLTNYWFIWIPAGVCLSLAVLGFNFVGDGLRDAFDPRMKR